MSSKKPVRVAVTGAAGRIGTSIIFPIAAGDVFGKDTPVILQLLELPDALGKLRGVEMELRDCAYGLLRDVVQTDFADKKMTVSRIEQSDWRSVLDPRLLTLADAGAGAGLGAGRRCGSSMRSSRAFRLAAL